MESTSADSAPDRHEIPKMKTMDVVLTSKVKSTGRSFYKYRIKKMKHLLKNLNEYQLNEIIGLLGSVVYISKEKGKVADVSHLPR